MPVKLDRRNLLQSCKELYRFLLNCQQIAVEKQSTQLVSISLEIEPVDPLVVLHQLDGSNQPSFYLQKSDFKGSSNFEANGFAIAAIGTAASLHVDGGDRFNRAKAFIRSTLPNTIIVGDSHLPFSGPHFFCSFGFFDCSSQGADSWSSFPAATVFLPLWQISHCPGRCTVVTNLGIQPESDLTAIVEQTWQTLQTIRNLHYDLVAPPVHSYQWLKFQDVASKAHFRQSVQNTLKSIQAGLLNKIVLAHAVDVISPLPFQPIFSLNNLRKLYPDCYIYSISNSQGQYFLGASPERLISLRTCPDKISLPIHLTPPLTHSQLVTDALAGSAPRGQTACEDAHIASNLLNSTKELHEHRLVIQFICQQLGQLGLAPHLSPLRLLQLSNIQHLHTPIYASVPPAIHLLDIVAKLHPTPAVAGVPRELACEQIRRYELFERSLYAAPIGWVDYQGNGEFAVGIRSALIEGHRARLYAGAGIVTGSNPEQELAEVQLKLQALLQTIR
jgi:menaquinone-specific isochorismate synthase